MTSSMRLSVFRRLLWKEYRTQRAFWIGIAVLAVLLICLGRFTVNYHDEQVRWQFGVALFLPALFAVACGGMLFAAEHEAGTFDFQRSLPLRPTQLLLAKVAFSLLSMLALYAVTLSAAMLISGSGLSEAFTKLSASAFMGRLPGKWGEYVLGMTLLAVEMFLWSTFFSLLLRRPLTAALAGTAAAATVIYVLTHCDPSAAFGKHRLVLGVVLLAIPAPLDIWLGLRWLGERRENYRSPSGRGAGGESGGTVLKWMSLRQIALVFGNRAQLGRSRRERGRNSSMGVAARLLWESWRQSRGLLLALIALCVATAISIRLDVVHAAVRNHNVSEAVGMGFGSWMVLLALATFPLAGALTFLGDQQRCSYRFLADRGVQPGRVWFSRQLAAWLVAVLLTVLVSVVAVANLLLVAPNLASHDVDVESLVKELIVAIVSLALLGVAAGQFCSMLFRNSLLAAFFGLLLGGVLALWYGLTWLWSINWFWSVLPIPLALLLATRLRTPHWLVERNTLRAWLPVVLALFVPAAAILTAVPIYRAYEIPLVTTGFSFSPEAYDRPMTAAEQATRDLYEAAFKQPYAPRIVKDIDTIETREPLWTTHRALTPREIAEVDANEKKIALTLAATRKTEGDLFIPRHSRDWILRDFLSESANLMLYGALRAEGQGHLDAAFERYWAAVRISVQIRQCGATEWWMHADAIEAAVYQHLPYWAARPNQTPQRIEAAARELYDLTLKLPPGTDVIKSEYLRLRSALSGGYEAMIKSDGGRGEDSWLPLNSLWWRLPWERTRALRLLNVVTRRQLDELLDVQAAAERGEPIGQPPYARSYRDEAGPYFGAHELPYALHEEINVPPIQALLQSEQGDRIRAYTAMLALRRGVRLSLLLEAWKLRHGALPETLDQLVGPDPDRAAIDPFTGSAFRYVRDGVGIPLRWHYSGIYFPYSNQLAANTPFIWSASPHVVLTGLTAENQSPNLNNYRIIDNLWSDDPQRRYPRYPMSDYDLWEAGVPIAVP